MAQVGPISVPLELTMTPTSREMVKRLVADVLMDGFPQTNKALVESELARKILDAINRAQEQINDEMLGPLEEISKYEVLVAGIKEFCEHQVKKASNQ